MPIQFIAKVFSIRPEYFFDGCVWNEPYASIPEGEELKAFMQERTKALYQTCLDDLLYYATYKNQNEVVLQKVRLAIQLLKQKVVE